MSSGTMLAVVASSAPDVVAPKTERFRVGYPLHTGLLEGINNKIKVLKRMPTDFGMTATSS